MRTEKSRTIGLPFHANEIVSASTTSLPDACASSTLKLRAALDFAPALALLAQRQQRTDATFVAGAARLDAAADPGLLLRELLVEERVVARLLLERRRLLGEEVRIVARPRGERAAVEFEDARREAR